MAVFEKNGAPRRIKVSWYLSALPEKIEDVGYAHHIQTQGPGGIVKGLGPVNL
jgi:hypothetical protein